MHLLVYGRYKSPTAGEHSRHISPSRDIATSDPVPIRLPHPMRSLMSEHHPPSESAWEDVNLLEDKFPIICVAMAVLVRKKSHTTRMPTLSGQLKQTRLYPLPIVAFFFWSLCCFESIAGIWGPLPLNEIKFRCLEILKFTIDSKIKPHYIWKAAQLFSIPSADANKIDENYNTRFG